MAGIFFTVEQLLAYVKPHLPEVARLAHGKLVEALGNAARTPVELPLPPLPGGDAPAAPDALQPIHPSDVLKDIAAAVGEAEKILNDRNLALTTGRLGVQLVVKTGDVAGAQATLDLQIGPSPQSWKE